MPKKRPGKPLPRDAAEFWNCPHCGRRNYPDESNCDACGKSPNSKKTK